MLEKKIVKGSLPQGACSEIDKTDEVWEPHPISQWPKGKGFYLSGLLFFNWGRFVIFSPNVCACVCMFFSLSFFTRWWLIHSNEHIHDWKAMIASQTRVVTCTKTGPSIICLTRCVKLCWQGNAAESCLTIIMLRGGSGRLRSWGPN